MTREQRVVHPPDDANPASSSRRTRGRFRTRVTGAAAPALAIAALLTATPDAPAYSVSSGAFDSLTVGARFAANTNSNEFHEFWESADGLELFATTPFYRAVVEVGIRYAYTSARSPDVPDFHSTFGYAALLMSRPVGSRAALRLGVGLGANHMLFDKNHAIGNRSELEMASEIIGGIEVTVTPLWRASFTARRMTIYTYRRIDLVFVSAGIARAFSMPGWLGAFLQ